MKRTNSENFTAQGGRVSLLKGTYGKLSSSHRGITGPLTPHSNHISIHQNRLNTPFEVIELFMQSMDKPLLSYI